MNKKYDQMNLNIDVRLEPQGTETTNLFVIVDRFDKNMVLVPPHQREFVWPDDKKRRWIKRIKNIAVQPVGVFVTYQLDNGKQGPVYINDGSQRIRATLEYLNNPQRYGDKKEDAITFVYQCKIPVQHRWYPDHDKALIDFQLLNIGTSLTPFELCKGVLSYMKGIEWQNLFDNLHIIVGSASNRVLRESVYSSKRENKHRFMRNNYALFYRFISREKSATAYVVSKLLIKIEDVSSKRVTEWKLRMELERIGIDEANRQLGLFKAMINRETALFESVWYKELNNEIGTAINHTLYGWLVHCSIWKRNNDIPHRLWEAFVIALLEATNGKSQFNYQKPDGKQGTYTLSLSALTKLVGACREIDCSEFYDYPKLKRKKSTKILKLGVDNSHESPFSLSGDGKTIPEPASRNRARGARAIS